MLGADYASSGAGGIMGIFMAYFVVLLLFALAIYIFTAVALMVLADKTHSKTPKWFAWIPVLNLVLMVDEAGLPIWTFLLFFLGIIPLVGGLLALIFELYVWWKIAERVGKPGWYSLLSLIPLIGPFISIGLIAWGK